MNSPQVGTKMYRVVWLSNGTPVVGTFTVVKATARTFTVRNQWGYELRGDGNPLLCRSIDQAIVQAIREECRTGTHWWDRHPVDPRNAPRDPREVLGRFAKLSRLVRKLERRGLIGDAA